MRGESDNFLAEQILLMVARELTDSLNTAAGIRATRRDSGQIRWVDGSGLSRYNLVTPNYLVGELDRIQSLIGWEGVQDYFPINGRRGTLKDRYETFDGIIYAKTGSLSNNYNLSGYLKSKSGKWYIFSYMHNHFIGEADELDEDIERVLYYLHSKL
jgi:D-alanyl-D-alanine carboxypeptidase/D-alanyl-D-alanine-endopeptidase (penicillin-binding protein 4)